MPDTLADRLRLCIACRQLLPRSRLIRVTASRDGRFSIDNVPALQGRSAYVCAIMTCLAEALKAKKFQRTLKRAIPGGIVEALEERLHQLQSSGSPPQPQLNDVVV